MNGRKRNRSSSSPLKLLWNRSEGSHKAFTDVLRFLLHSHVAPTGPFPLCNSATLKNSLQLAPSLFLILVQLF